MYTVYKHTAPNGKVYIGITGQKPEYRWDKGNGYKDNPHFYSAILKYGWENIRREIVDDGLTKEQARDLEIELIAKCHATDPRYGYNNSTRGDCGMLGVHQGAETQKGSNGSMCGKHHSAETRRKLSEANKGKHLSAEHRREIGEANKGKHPSPETRRKLSESHKGKHLRHETRVKIGEAKKGQIPWNKGAHLSVETRRKMSDAHKGKTAYWNKKAVICAETGTVYSSIAEAAESIGVTKSGITKVLHGIYKTSGGFHWRYAGGEQ